MVDIDLELAGAGVQLLRQRTMSIVELIGSVGRGRTDQGQDGVGRLGLVAVVRADGDEIVELQVAVHPGALAARAGAGRIRRREIASGGRALGASRQGETGHEHGRRLPHPRSPRHLKPHQWSRPQQYDGEVTGRGPLQ